MEETLAKYFSGECSKDEMDLIHSWRNESSENAKSFFEAKNVWISTSEKPEANIEVLERILNETEGKQVKVSFGWMRYAAAAIVVLGLAFALITFLNNGEANVHKLADGSEITLHNDASIVSVNITDDIREVTLTGKAYFDIERDESRPFIVNTDYAKVQVLGTSFLIDASSAKTEVCVESGLVSLIKPGIQGKTDLSVKLAKGEMGSVNSTAPGIIKKNNDNANYLAWKTKSLTFDRSRMSEVEATLEDVYGVDVVFENENLGDCRLTAKFKERKIKDAIEIIARTFDLTYEIKNDQVLMKGKGC